MYRLGIVVLLAVAGCASIDNYPPIQGPFGSVSKSTGLPAVLRNSQPYILAEQSQIFVGDVITTNEISRVDITLKTGQTVQLSPGSQWLIIEVLSDGLVYASDTSLTRGSLRIQGDEQMRHRMTVRTSIARVQTFADNFWMGYGKITDAELIVLALDNTTIIVSNTDGALTLDGEMQATTVTPGSAPQDAVGWSQQKLTNTIEFYNAIP